MTNYTFELRFRDKDEEAGHGTLHYKFDTIGTTFIEISRAVDAVQQQHPNVVLDRIVYFSEDKLDI
jgi:hypothetical protein